MSWRPSDARKDRGEVEADQCPDCRHDVEDCVCEDGLETLTTSEQEPVETGDLGAPRKHIEKMIEHGRRIYRSDDCAYCEAHKNDSMMPPHQASFTCESGKYNHCTCDTCY